MVVQRRSGEEEELIEPRFESIQVRGEPHVFDGEVQEDASSIVPDGVFHLLNRCRALFIVRRKSCTFCCGLIVRVLVEQRQSCVRAVEERVQLTS